MVVGGGSAGSPLRWKPRKRAPTLLSLKRIPTSRPGNAAEQIFLEDVPPELRARDPVQAHQEQRQVKIYTMAEVEKISGSEGNFDVTIKTQPGS